MFHQQRTLLMNNDYTGACELTGLRCDASLAAEVRLAALRELIRAALASLRGECVDVIVELPGVRDEHGGSPFWNGLGRRFYEGDPQQAESRFGEAWVSHVAALLPRSPLIVSFLPETAQKSIGEVAPEASEQLEALQLEGFRRSRYVAIDDAGPVLEISLQA